MKVLLVNGSHNKNGCTYTALSEVAGALEKNGIETEIFHLGTKAISGCVGCYSCMKTGKCFMNDQVNEFLEKAYEADGFIFGSPVHFASSTGRLTSFMDRLFFTNIWTGSLSYKPVAAVMSARRAGTTATFDQMNKYFTMSNMPVVSSQYWNSVHGNTPDEVNQDLEGMQTMRTLGNNMAWMLKSIEAGKAAGVTLPEKEAPALTNFIR
ncbi:NADPH-dependent FMN reductase [Clostridium sp. DL-VIII]|uniref:flavodoxin family protein n=1 Tax=Clostridium sp. DL-VIII TaxID=641107 RepID=UPI00023B08D2|nr:flavodoxin family protein [Clostridium sp. DL-VIII]EHJ02252.1 NADPH-dependent FMN reductase [Clostridium sp. DL-VIII]